MGEGRSREKQKATGPVCFCAPLTDPIGNPSRVPVRTGLRQCAEAGRNRDDCGTADRAARKRALGSGRSEAGVSPICIKAGPLFAETSVLL